MAHAYSSFKLYKHLTRNKHLTTKETDLVLNRSYSTLKQQLKGMSSLYKAKW